MNKNVDFVQFSIQIVFGAHALTYILYSFDRIQFKMCQETNPNQSNQTPLPPYWMSTSPSLPLYQEQILATTIGLWYSKKFQSCDFLQVLFRRYYNVFWLSSAVIWSQRRKIQQNRSNGKFWKGKCLPPVFPSLLNAHVDQRFDSVPPRYPKFWFLALQGNTTLLPPLWTRPDRAAAQPLWALVC